MNKKRFEIVEELDPANVSGVPDVHKKHYEELGYRPYRMGDGKVKWLTEGEKAYNKTRGMPDPKRRSKKVSCLRRQIEEKAARQKDALDLYLRILGVSGYGCDHSDRAADLFALSQKYDVYYGVV